VNQGTTETVGRQSLRASRDALLQRAAEEPDLTWRVLTTLNAFRALIAVALLGGTVTKGFFIFCNLRNSFGSCK
jgi:hypothetical protein